MRTESIFPTPSALTEVDRLQPLMHFERGNIALYTFRGGEAPHLMLEVGRLREQAFRRSGGGTGREVDIDADDVATDGYRQLIAWDVGRRRIVGGYRYIVGRECAARHISSSHYFHLSPRFRRDYLPHAIELGRSFTVRGGTTGTAASASAGDTAATSVGAAANEGAGHNATSLFAMESLWRALGHIVHREGISYLFGKVTIYPHYDAAARRLLLQFLEKFHPAREPLMWPMEDERYAITENDSAATGDTSADDIGLVSADCMRLTTAANPFTLDDYGANYALLEELLRQRGERLPPMLHAYMRLTREVEYFGAVRNPDFGHATEAAILLRTDSITPNHRRRYIF